MGLANFAREILKKNRMDINDYISFDWFSASSNSGSWFSSEWAVPTLICLGTAGLIFFVVRRVVRPPSEENLRLGLSAAGETEDDNGLFGPMTDALAAQIPESKKERGEFRKLLRGAGLYRPKASASIYAARFLLLFLPLVIAGVWAVLAPAGSTFKILFLGGAAAATLSILPRFYVYLRRRKRREQIRAGLPRLHGHAGHVPR